MNHVSRRDPYAEETARIREVVERHARPPFVTGFDVRLGEFDGDPAMWIIFETIQDGDVSPAPRIERATLLEQLRKTVQAELLEEFETRFPYFRFAAQKSLGIAGD